MRRFLLILLALSLVFSASCAKKAPSDENAPSGEAAAPKEIAWSERTFSESFSDEQSGSNPLVILTVSLPLVENNDEINAYYENVASSLRDAGEGYLGVARENLTFAAESNGIFSPYAIDASFEVARNDGKVFSVVRNVYENTGGAHPNTVAYCESFDAQTGALITADDLFSVPFDTAAEALKPQITEMMDARGQETGMGGDMYYPNAKEDLFSLWDKKDFYLTETSLVLVWQSYSLAPYAAGIQLFEIPFDKLDSVIDLKWIP